MCTVLAAHEAAHLEELRLQAAFMSLELEEEEEVEDDEVSHGVWA